MFLYNISLFAAYLIKIIIFNQVDYTPLDLVKILNSWPIVVYKQHLLPLQSRDKETGSKV